MTGEGEDGTMMEFKQNDAQALSDEELGGVTGGTEGYWGGSATGKTCACGCAGPHPARQYYDYDATDNSYTVTRLEV